MKKQFLIPIICLIVLGIIFGSIYFINNRQRKFSVPDRNKIKKLITNQGYTPGEFDSSSYKKLGIESFYKLYIKDKNDDKMNIGFNEYDIHNSAFKVFNDYYTSAVYLNKKGEIEGKVKLYYDEKNQRGYIFYPGIRLKSSNLVDNYAFGQASADIFNSDNNDYVYGGIYYDQNRLLLITTNDINKTTKVIDILEQFKLPR